MIKKFLQAEVRSVSAEEGTFEVVASSGKVDRLGDTIDPKGWYLKNYKKNPVILWSHSAGGFLSPAIPPVARADKVWVEDEKELKIKGRFADTPFARELRTLVEGGFLNAVSVGFMPLVEEQKGDIEMEGKTYRRATDEEIQKGIYDNEYGEKFTKQELLEVSWVSVPALPQALVSAKEMKLALVTKALEEEIKENKFESYKDNSGTTRYRTKIKCPDCSKERWVDKRNVEKESFTGLCKECSAKNNQDRYIDGRWHQSDGYIGILASEVEPEFQCMKDSRNYIYEHRYVVAKKLGRPLGEFEQVHHLNGIKDDNRPENLEIVGEGEHLLITRMQERIKELEGMIIKPYPNEHSCRLQPPDKYKRFRRENCQRKHDGKCIDVIWGITKGEEEKTEQQAFRYDKEVWTEASARTHCKDNDGAFEPASKELTTEQFDIIRKFISETEEAMSVLKGLLPETGAAPADTKGRKPFVSQKSRKSDMERLLIMFDKMCEALLRKLRQ